MRIAPSTVPRPRVAAWLERRADLPLRALIAPAGYGKTTALAQYLDALDTPHAYVRAAPADTSRTLAARIAEAVGLEPVTSFDDLRAVMASMRCTLAVDALDLATSEAISRLCAFAIAGPRRVATIVAGCGGATVNTPRIYTQGLAATLGREELAFTHDDTAALCEALGVAYDAAAVRALVHVSDGWPVVVCGVVRLAASEGLALTVAYDEWIAANAAMLRDFTGAEVRRAGERPAALFARAVMEENLLDDEWAEIEGAGLFACRSGTTIRLLQPVLAAYARGPRGGRAPMPLVISLFGAFEARYGGAPVRWLRRRDMEIVRALLFRPAGASRDELIERFWPQTERLAAQRSLRTACSTIRKAIAHAVGAERVDRYFTAGNHVMLHESAISLDAHRFASHVRLGDEAFDAGRRDRAVAHYRAALRLHVGPPAIDPGDAPQAAYAAQLTAAFERTTTRLAELEPVAERTDGNSVPPSPPGASRAAS